MNSFGHGVAFRWRPAAAVHAAGRFIPLSAIVLFALLAGADAAAAQSASASGRAVLYDEDLSDPTGHQYLGSVKWRTEVTRLAGQSDDVAVVADVEIALRKFKMTLLLKRNFDKSLPASHVVELTFHLPSDFAGGGIGNVPGLLMKTSETARGLPLAGLSVKVTDGFFLVGLSDTPADRERNRQSLLERAWFDIPIVYADQRRAIVAIEKGASGDQAFKTAFTAWGQYAPATQAAPVAPDGNDAAGSYVVQVSSQRSEADAQASYKVLQDKFPGVLGAWVPIITRADTGTNGIFYRAAVGPFKTADEASQFCSTLKAAGGQCVVQRN
jgi:hypothetical protein